MAKQPEFPFLLVTMVISDGSGLYETVERAKAVAEDLASEDDDIKLFYIIDTRTHKIVCRGQTLEVVTRIKWN